VLSFGDLGATVLRLLPLCLLPLLTACQTDCDDFGRFDGDWVAWSHDSSGEAAVTGYDGDELEEAQAIAAATFANGGRTWTLQYVPNSEALRVKLDGQAWDGKFTPEPDNCNIFALTFGGEYGSDRGSVHSFEWSGQLTFLGDQLNGTFSYADSWILEDRSGTLNIPAGEVEMTLPTAEEEG
jgi:hypothetical protein